MNVKDTTVIVLGASGMLGSMVTDVLSRNNNLNIIATVRSSDFQDLGRNKIPSADWRIFNVDSHAETEHNLFELGEAAWVINAIGLTKPYTHDDNPEEIERALIVNSMFPYLLARVFQRCGGRVIQIATDCVFAGQRDHYIEDDNHDPLDVYGKTKSLGEAPIPNIHHLRASIIGPEPKTFIFLLEWFRRQQQGTNLNGFTNHKWNGITTLQFARICQGIISDNISLPQLQHLVPNDEVSKYELLGYLSTAYSRSDITIASTEAPSAINRTLSTKNHALNRKLWDLAGYGQEPPNISEMIKEIASFDYRLND